MFTTTPDKMCAIKSITCTTRADNYQSFVPQFQPLPNNKTLNWSKFNTLADKNLNEVQMMLSSFDRAENIVGKGENAGNQHFLLFPQCFKKSLLSKGLLKVVIVW